MTDALPILLPALLTFLLAGFVKGVIGLGLPTIAMGLLGLVMPPVEAAALLVVPSLVTNLWQLFAGPRFGRLVRRLWPLMLGVSLGTLMGGGLADTSGRAAMALGIALMLYAVTGLTRLKFRVSPRAEHWLALPVGALTGLVAAATGVFVLPAVPYLQALDLEKEDLVQALGLFFTVSTLALAAALLRDGGFALPFAGTSLLALAPALAGMAAGQWLRLRVEAATFRRLFFLGLLALGAYLAARGVI